MGKSPESYNEVVSILYPITESLSRIAIVNKMPEGPEVRRCAESLSRHILGTTLEGLDITEKSRYFRDGGFPGSQLLEYGSTVENVGVKGKRIILTFRNPNGAVVYLVSFLGMEGHWLLKKGNHSGVIITFGTHKMIKQHHFILLKTLYYDDSRHFGQLECFNTYETMMGFMKNVGPDLLNDEVSLELYWTRLRLLSFFSEKEIVWFLLEQKYFSGVGNYLKSEILYMSRLSPKRLLGSLSDIEIETLYTMSLQVIREAYEKNGLTIATYTDVDGNPGMYEPRVYGRTTTAEGYQIVKEVLSDKRATYWVPQIQV